ncbi:MAG TPA: hypothetical protein VNA67_06855 [Pseudonocardiaceae bacterium]|nr:hypothetical protein [Pseudonocardiaceae bacterium]
MALFYNNGPTLPHHVSSPTPPDGRNLPPSGRHTCTTRMTFGEVTRAVGKNGAMA